MPLTLSDDLRQALDRTGTPLKLVDPETGERYVLVRESAFVSGQLSNEQLLELARRHRPPDSWLQDDEPDVF
jgi:hypothetical protein